MTPGDADAALRPNTGARYVVELVEHDGATARYVGALYLPDGAHPLEVALTERSAWATIEGPAAAKAHEKQAAALIRAAARLPRDPDAGPPPRRIVRWRG